MLRTTPRRRRGRPFGPSPCFSRTAPSGSTPCCLAKARGRATAPTQKLRVTSAAPGRCSGPRTVTPQQRMVELRVTASRQPLGGVRRWWRCPVCHRRCRLLLAADPRAPIGCRRCLQARYAGRLSGPRSSTTVRRAVPGARVRVTSTSTTGNSTCCWLRDAAASAGAGASSCGRPARWGGSGGDVTPCRASSMEVSDAVDHHDRPSLRPLRADRR